MSINTAYGMMTGNSYSINDIGKPDKYASMKCEPLVDEHGVPLTPVRLKGSYHYRRLGGEVQLQGLPRAPKDPTHDQIVRTLHQRLDASEGKLEFYTYVFDNDYRQKKKAALEEIERRGMKEDKGFIKEYLAEHAPIPEQPLFMAPKNEQYAWFKEATGVIRFSDERFIQPDITGRGSSTLTPTGRLPGLIIEVIRTHIPDQETFKKLVQLSRMAYQVYFYFTDSKGSASRYNDTRTCKRDGVNFLRIRVAIYLQGGELVSNGEVVGIPSSTPKPVFNEDDPIWVQGAINRLNDVRLEHEPKKA